MVPPPAPARDAPTTTSPKETGTIGDSHKGDDEEMGSDGSESEGEDPIRQVLYDLQASSHNEETQANVQGNVIQPDASTQPPPEHEKTEILSHEDTANLSPSNPLVETTFGTSNAVVATGDDLHVDIVPPSFSIVLTQEEAHAPSIQPEPLGIILHPAPDTADITETLRNQRPRIPPSVLQDYELDPKSKVGFRVLPDLHRLFDHLRKTVIPLGFVHLDGPAINRREFLDIAFRTAQIAPLTMNVIMRYLAVEHEIPGKSLRMYDTSLHVAIKNQYSKFVKMAVHLRPKFKFTDDVLLHLRNNPADVLYFPLYVEPNHWVAVIVDTKAGALHVLLCNVALKTDGMIKKELNPLLLI